MSVYFLFLLLIGLSFSKVLFDPDAPPAQSVLARHVDYRMLEARALSSPFVVSYVGTPPGGAAQTAIAAAYTLLGSFFNLNVQIFVSIQWTDLSFIPGLLGNSAPAAICAHPDSTNFQYVLIPSALYSVLTSAEGCPGSGSIHVHMSLNSHPPAPWYVGSDGNVPVGFIDLITVVMHETIHGLGFFSGVSNGNGAYPHAPYGIFYDWYMLHGHDGWPNTFDQQVSSPCVEDTSILTGGALTYHASSGSSSVANFNIYSPNPFQTGSSLSHVNPSGDTSNSLMFPSLGAGTARHDLGGNVWSVLSTFGYPMVFVPAFGTGTTGIANSHGERLVGFFY